MVPGHNLGSSFWDAWPYLTIFRLWHTQVWVRILDVQWCSAGYHRAGLRECPRGSSHCHPSGPTNEVLGMQKYTELGAGSLGRPHVGYKRQRLKIIETENLEDIKTDTLIMFWIFPQSDGNQNLWVWRSVAKWMVFGCNMWQSYRKNTWVGECSLKPKDLI